LYGIVFTRAASRTSRTAKKPSSRAGVSMSPAGKASSQARAGRAVRTKVAKVADRIVSANR
jgi:hypothetical protein